LRPLNERCGVWLAQHDKTDETRVFKFALEPQQIRILKRELTIHRVLRRGLGQRDDIVRLLDYNLQDLPYFLKSSTTRKATCRTGVPLRGAPTPLHSSLRSNSWRQSRRGAG